MAFPAELQQTTTEPIEIHMYEYRIVHTKTLNEDELNKLGKDLTGTTTGQGWDLVNIQPGLESEKGQFKHRTDSNFLLVFKRPL
jgi:hypothetical protein